MASRGASLEFLSQFPHEAELLFPPETLLECKPGHKMHCNKRLVVVAPTASTARPVTSGISTPDDVPGGLSLSSVQLGESRVGTPISPSTAPTHTQRL